MNLIYKAEIDLETSKKQSMVTKEEGGGKDWGCGTAHANWYMEWMVNKDLLYSTRYSVITYLGKDMCI